VNILQIPIIGRWLKKRSDRYGKWDKWLDLMGASQASSGVYVGEDSAMTAASVLACLRLLSFTMAMLPLPLYEKLSTGGKRKATEHPLYYILHDSPNGYQTAFEYRQQVMTNMLLYGNHYSLIGRDKASGEVTELLPLFSPTSMEVQLFENEPRYKYTLSSGESVVLWQDQVLHIRGMSTNGLLGVDLLNKGREQIGLALALQKYAAKFFGRGANISGVLEHPETLSKEAQERLKAAWDKTYSGIENAHKVAILEEGMKFAKMGASPEEAQALESRKFQTLEVARIFGVPPHMIGDLERATFSNIEHQGIEFVTFCIAPWATLIEQRISKQLLNSNERRLYFAEFSLEALMRGDYKSRQEGLHIQRQDGVINANEWRALENMNPIEGEVGTAYLVNGNMISVDMAIKGGITGLKQSDQEEEGES
jgi:HK97 family phage portal protein